jgi:phage regulator Rha-like protein
MDELRITETTMNSREIAELTGKRHDHVLRDIETQIEDPPHFGEIYLDTYKREQRCYNLPYRETMILISGYSVELRTKIVDRWLKLESPKIQSNADIFKLAYENAIKLEALEKQALLDAPKVDMADHLMMTDDCMSITEASKHFKLKPKMQVFPFLRENGFLTQRELPTQKAINLNVMIAKQSKPDKGGLIHTQAAVMKKQLPSFEKYVALPLKQLELC